jgi:hypothetical protein
MSEITKLYENAGIKPTHYDACALEDKYWKQLLDIQEVECEKKN